MVHTVYNRAQIFAKIPGEGGQCFITFSLTCFWKFAKGPFVIPLPPPSPPSCLYVWVEEVIKGPT